jgi:hypothetical protein
MLYDETHLKITKAMIRKYLREKEGLVYKVLKPVTA